MQRSDLPLDQHEFRSYTTEVLTNRVTSMTITDRYFFAELSRAIGDHLANVWLHENGLTHPDSEGDQHSLETDENGKSRPEVVVGTMFPTHAWRLDTSDPPGKKRALSDVWTALERRAADSYHVTGANLSNQNCQSATLKALAICNLEPAWLRREVSEPIPAWELEHARLQREVSAPADLNGLDSSQMQRGKSDIHSLNVKTKKRQNAAGKNPSPDQSLTMAISEVDLDRDTVRVLSALDLCTSRQPVPAKQVVTTATEDTRGLLFTDAAHLVIDAH